MPGLHKLPMPITRFEELKRFLRFSDNSVATNSTDKIMPVLEQVKKSCQKAPFEENISCDEQIIPFKGEPELGAASNIIVRLYRPLPRYVYQKLYFDNYFSSLHLISYLDKLGIKSVATIRSNRIKNLETMSEKKMKKKWSRLTRRKTATVNGVDVHAVQWYDNRIVSLASSYCGTDPITEVRRMHMGGVDLQDSLIRLYPMKIKSKKWYMRIFCHMIDIAVVNAWLLSK
nr:unnamed protein product [Callosobruchus analis]